MGRRGCIGRHEAAQVHHAPYAGDARGVGERPGGAAVALGEVTAVRGPGRLHRVDEEVRAFHAFQGSVEPRACDGVALYHRHMGAHAAGRAAERPHVVAVACQPRDQRCADESAGSGDEDLGGH